jgi:hypothetical protein
MKNLKVREGNQEVKAFGAVSKRNHYRGFILAQQPPLGQDLLNLKVFKSHTSTHHTQSEYSGRGIGPSQRPLPDKTQRSQQKHILVPGGIRTITMI